MTRADYILFLIPTLIWGSTWYVITFQLGVVDPMVSVAYRFGLAGTILLIYSKIRGLNLSFPPKQHLFIGLQGIMLFGLNYWLVYLSERTLNSGLVAVAFSTLIFFNLFFGALFLGDKIRRTIIFAAVIGLSGTVLIYQADLNQLTLGPEEISALIYCGLSLVLASLGNIISARNQRKYSLPVVQTNAFGMTYGAIAMFLIALLTGKPFTIDTSFSYLLSMGYLTIFGSIFAFTAYLTMIGKIGAGKAAYAIVAIPVIALTLSAIFEGYTPDKFAYLGLFLILTGNVLALRNMNS